MLKKIQLKNGLKVILAESHRAPVVSIQTWVRTGSADEGKGEEGISHFIEHLVFKGTRKFKMGEISQAVEAAGGELNAYTSFDQTVFYITLSKQDLQLGLTALSEMMGFPLFDPAEIDAEREVVIEEVKRGQDSLGRKASQLLFSTAYKKHSYGIPVIGYEKNIRKWSPKKIKDYFQTKYVPKNMFLVISGSFDSKTIQHDLERTFGEMVNYKVKKTKRKQEPKQTKPKVATEQSTFEQTVTYWAWPVPNLFHKDIPALDILSVILGQGDSSRLVKALRIDQAMVNSIGVSLFAPQDRGLFTVSAAHKKESTEEIQNKIVEILRDVMVNGITQEELSRALVNLESEQLYSLESVDGLSRQFGNAEFLFGNPNAFDSYLKKLRAVSTEDVRKAAVKYLNGKVSLSASVVQAGAAEQKKILQKFAKELSAKLPKAKLKPKAKKAKLSRLPKLKFSSGGLNIERETLSNGVRVLWIPIRDTHVVSAKAAFRGGIRAEPENLEGLTEILSRTWPGGTSKLSEMEIANLIEDKASGISPTSGRNTIGLGLETLAGFEKEMASVYLDLLTDPTFPSEVMEREKTILKEQIKSKRDNPAQTCMRLFAQAMYKNHPYSRDPLGSDHSITAIKAKDLAAMWTKTSQRKNLVMTVAGNFDQAFWRREILEKTQRFAAGSALTDHFPLSPPESGKVHYEFADKEQSHLIVGFPGYSLFAKERLILDLIQSLLAGQGGRLFLELRDKNSLAYSVSPLKMEGIEGGYFGAYIGCSPEKVRKAYDMMRVEFQKLMDIPVGDHELARAKRYLIGRHDIDLQRTGAIASTLIYEEIYGLDSIANLDVAKLYGSITAQDIRRVAREIFSQPGVIALVGRTNEFGN